MKNKLFILIAFSILGSSTLFGQEDDKKKEEKYFEINKNIEIFNSVLRELDLFYVDSLNVTKSVRTGIDYMLNSFDPYTTYFDEEDAKDFKFMTTGEYAGVGSTIIFRDGKICIADPFEGKPAAKAGLKAGDLILEIDGKDMTTCEKKEGEAYSRTLSNYVSSHLKGQPSTSIKIKVERPGVKKPMTFKVDREIIIVDAIPYYGMLDNGTGYISLNSFTDKSAQEVKNAFLDLKKQGIKSLIFDLRQNGGGIMEDAIEIVNMFVPKGKMIVSTKGKLQQQERSYRTTLEPIDTDIPIVVLVDKGSASASEIVAGSLQDLDRAVLMGERTFGKGLVQTTRPIPYSGTLKVTTSKYYIPSGRCVQAIDYSHRNEDGSVGRIPDSLTSVFQTSIGREVRDGGGVSPDVEVKEEKVPNITYYLSNQFIIFDWATNWTLDHKTIESPSVFSISDPDYESFKEYVKSKDFKYDRISEKSMNSLKEVMEFEGYMKLAEEEFKALEAKLIPDLDRDLETFKPEIIKLLNAEIIKRYFYQKGEIIFNLKSDKILKEAIQLVNDDAKYKEILSVTTETKNEEDEK